MKRMRVWLAAVCAAAITASGGCVPDRPESVADKDVIRVGIRTDLPLLSQDVEGGYEGFEIDVAEYIADHLGAEVEWVPLTSAERESHLVDGVVDVTIAAYSITQSRKQRVAFAGPYVLGYFNILVRSGEDSIGDVDDLAGRRVCAVKGSNVIDRMRDEYGVAVDEHAADGYDECMDALADGEIDAITTDEFILAGLRDSRPDLDLTILDARYSQERIGVGIRKDDTAGCEEINRAITQMYTDGTVHRLLERWFGSAGLDVDDPPIPQYEGCE